MFKLLHFVTSFFVKNKNEALCDEAEFLDINHSFALIRYPDGRESTVSTTDLARSPNGGKENSPAIDHDHQPPSTSNADNTTAVEIPTTNQTDLRGNDLYEVSIGEKSSLTFSEDLRRANHERKPPEQFLDCLGHFQDRNQGGAGGAKPP